VLRKWTREVLIRYDLAYGQSSSFCDQRQLLKCVWVAVLVTKPTAGFLPLPFIIFVR
jgi:hypothetical protein